jgi:hypothetical protein
MNGKEAAVARQIIPACAMQPNEMSVEVFKEQSRARRQGKLRTSREA